MPKHTVNLTAPPGHVLLPPLTRLGIWLARQQHGADGWFDLWAGSIPRTWNPDQLVRPRWSCRSEGNTDTVGYSFDVDEP